MDRRSAVPDDRTAARRRTPVADAPALPANTAVRWVLGSVLVEAAALLVFYLRAH